MKINIILAIFAFVYCTNGQSTQSSASTTSSGGLKEELAKSAEELLVRVKNEIAKLQVEKREHLAIVLGGEEWRVRVLVNELRIGNPDPVRLAVIEAELIELEFRVTKELSILERDTIEQEVLLANAQTIKKWVEEEIKKLETQNNEQAHQATIDLQHQLTTLNHMVSELTKAQELKAIERFEVVLRAIEIHIYETLKHLGFKPNTTRYVDHATLYERTRLPLRTTPTHSTPSPIQLKKDLTKKAEELEGYAATEITRLTKENRISMIKGLQSLQMEVKEIGAKLQKTTTTQILELIESELYWLERRLAIETEGLMYEEKRIEKLLAIAVALEARIDSSIKLLASTTVAKALQSEAKHLKKLSIGLKSAKDDKSILNMEAELASIEKRVNDQLRPVFP